MFPCTTTASLRSLAEISASIQYGYTSSASQTEIGPKFLRITDIVPPHIEWKEVPHCHIEESLLERYSLAEGDLVIARTGATVGHAKLIRDPVPSVFASYLIRIRINPEKADPGYVGRIVESDQYKRFVLSRVGGAAQPSANAKILSSFRLPIPSRRAQRRIVSILSTYENLIEDNRRRIQLLEQSARLLYKEWFVHLRFPGHEHVKIKDGVPEGWSRKPLLEIADPTYGFAFKSNLFNTHGDGLPVARIRDIRRGESQTHTIEDAPKERRLEDGDFIIGMDGDFHMNFWTGGTAWINQRVVRIRGRGDFCDAFLRYSLEKPIRDFNASIAGTTVAHLGAKHLKLIRVLIPTKSILDVMQESLRSVQSQIVVLTSQSRRTRNARDLLLPRLIKRCKGKWATT